MYTALFQQNCRLFGSTYSHTTSIIGGPTTLRGSFLYAHLHRLHFLQMSVALTINPSIIIVIFAVHILNHGHLPLLNVLRLRTSFRVTVTVLLLGAVFVHFYTTKLYLIQIFDYFILKLFLKMPPN